MLLNIFIEFFIRHLLPEFNNHLSPNLFKHLVNPQRSLTSLSSLREHYLKNQMSILHHFNLGNKYLHLKLLRNFQVCSELMQTMSTVLSAVQELRLSKQLLK
jgi:hypothetical protein